MDRSPNQTGILMRVFNVGAALVATSAAGNIALDAAFLSIVQHQAGVDPILIGGTVGSTAVGTAVLFGMQGGLLLKNIKGVFKGMSAIQTRDHLIATAATSLVLPMIVPSASASFKAALFVVAASLYASRLEKKAKTVSANAP